MKNKRQKLSKYCQKFSFMVDVHYRHVKTDMIESIFGLIKENARVIGTPLKETKIQKIEISSITGIVGPTCYCDMTGL